MIFALKHESRILHVVRGRSKPGWQFNWLKFSLEKPLEFWLEFWLEFPLDSAEEKGPF